MKDRLLIGKNSSYQSFKVFNNDYFKGSSKQIIEKTEFTELSIEILERVKRKAHKLRISYKFVEPKKLIKNGIQEKENN